MLLNKRLRFIIITFIIVLLVGAYAIYLIEYRMIENAVSLTKGVQRSHDCEAFESLILLSPISLEARETIGEMYSLGWCVQFNLERSIEWFRRASLTDEQIGHMLFSVLGEQPSSDGIYKGLSKDQNELLISKIKTLKFKPSQVELDLLPVEYKTLFK